MPTAARYGVNARLTAAKVYDDEAIVINTATGRYYDLEGSGPDIWTLLIDGVTVAEAAESLAGTYDVEVDVAATDVESFLERLHAEELIVLVEEATTPTAAGMLEVEERAPYVAPTVTTFTDMEELLAADPPMPSSFAPVWQAPTAGD